MWLRRKAKTSEDASAPKKRRWLWRAVRWSFALLIVALIIARIFLAASVRQYVNRVLDSSQTFKGQIGDVSIHLWRGAYSIEDIKLIKTTGDVPVPLFAAKRVDLSIEWDALLHAHVVGRVLITEPELNFVDAGDQEHSQTDPTGPWLQIIRDLFPFKINRVRIEDGSIHFRTYRRATPVDVYLSQLNATVDNLTNIRDTATPLNTTVQATGLAMDQAKFEYNMKLDAFSYYPTFDMTMRLLGLDVTKTNELAKTYGDFDFEKGLFDLVIETSMKSGRATGSVKALFRDLQIFSLSHDVPKDNVLEVFWEALLGTTAEILKNPQRNQFGTQIPFTADLSSAQPDIFAAVGNVLRNAFVRAYLPKLDRPQEADEGMTFSAPTISDSISVGD